ncbi:acyl carrier protein [Acidithiobacillus sp. MC6.1]|nr:acyl carrier protein [Acidithiobacillus sp. MC6.1]
MIKVTNFIFILQEQFAIDRDRLSESARLFEDLGLDSMDSVELVMALEMEFDGEVPDRDITHIKTVGDVIQAVLTYCAPSGSAV